MSMRGVITDWEPACGLHAMSPAGCCARCNPHACAPQLPHRTVIHADVARALPVACSGAVQVALAKESVLWTRGWYTFPPVRCLMPIQDIASSGIAF